MKLSEAIRLGAMLGPQARGHLTRVRRKYFFFGPVVNEYCALGAAFVASGAKSVQRRYEDEGTSHGGFRGAATLKHKRGDTYTIIDHQWNDLMWMDVGCPQCPGEVMPMYRMIPHLNDSHRWTREAIADWVQTIEPSEITTITDDSRTVGAVAGTGA